MRTLGLLAHSPSPIPMEPSDAGVAGSSFTRTWRAFAHEFGVAFDGSELETADELLARLRDGAALEQAVFDVHRLLRQRDLVRGGATVGIGDEVRATRWDK